LRRCVLPNGLHSAFNGKGGVALRIIILWLIRVIIITVLL